MSYENCGSGKVSTLCWKCAKACNGGCDWSKSFTPVEGWEAVQTKCKTGAGDDEPSYLVLNCPEFVHDSSDGRIKDLDTDGCMALVEYLLKKSREDYIKGTDIEGKKIERFIRGRGASKIHQIQNPDKVIRELNDDREKYREKRRREMEQEKIKKIMKALRCCIKLDEEGKKHADCENCPQHYSNGQAACPEYGNMEVSVPHQTISDALDYMQKLIEKKPLTDDKRNRLCPNCKTILKGRVCHECGQAIIWE